MKRLLFVSPHFPPDATAGAHRGRLLARHLPAFGWKPTVLAVAPRGQDGADESLLSLVDSNVDVVRVDAWPQQTTRTIGFGDLGLRSLTALRRAGARLLSRGGFDGVYITIYPVYPALLGPRWRRQFAMPFVVDYQDPWVGEWGRSVGGGADGSPDLRSKVSRWVGLTLEPRVLQHAAGVTAVSHSTCEALWQRYPDLRRPQCAVPLGADPADFAPVRQRLVHNRIFQKDGLRHIAYVGTVLPLGRAIVEALLYGLRLLRLQRPELADRVRVHFVGSSNQTTADAAPVIAGLAHGLGIGDIVSEHAARVPYLEALAVLDAADVVLALGSTEPHYSPSKLYPCLLANRPMLAVYRTGSDAAQIMQRVSEQTTGRVLLTFDCPIDRDALAQDIASRLQQLLSSEAVRLPDVSSEEIDRWSARSSAREIASFLDRVMAPQYVRA